MKNYFYILIILLTISLSGCGNATPQSTVSLTPAITMTSPPLATNTVAPTATSPLPAVFVVIPGETEPSIVDQTLPVIEELATQSGMEVKTVSTISPQDLINQDARIIVIFSPFTNFTEIAQAMPSTQILGISFTQVEPSKNVSLIQVIETGFDTKSFLAGFIAAVVTTDWRIGLVTQVGDEKYNAIKTTFNNGVSYFCGLCQSVYPPYPISGYPLYYEYSKAPGDLDALIAYFQEWQIKTIYLPSPLDQDEDLLKTLIQSGFQLIAERLPPDGLQANWVASLITADLNQAITDLWPKLMSGEGGAQVNLSFTVMPGSEALFSPGRQTLVNQVLDDLLKGYIDTGVAGLGQP
jgi:hypothetical protein